MFELRSFPNRENVDFLLLGDLYWICSIDVSFQTKTVAATTVIGMTKLRV